VLSKETLAQLLDVIARLGIPTVLAGVLLWFLLHYIHSWLAVARATQLAVQTELAEVEALVQRCCPRTP
jgi:hypothetical protein